MTNNSFKKSWCIDVLFVSKKSKMGSQKPSNELTENTKIKIGKSEINLNTFQFSVWILVLYKLLNFDF